VGDRHATTASASATSSASLSARFGVQGGLDPAGEPVDQAGGLPEHFEVGVLGL